MVEDSTSSPSLLSLTIDGDSHFAAVPGSPEALCEGLLFVQAVIVSVAATRTAEARTALEQDLIHSLWPLNRRTKMPSVLRSHIVAVGCLLPRTRGLPHSTRPWKPPNRAAKEPPFRTNSHTLWPAFCERSKAQAVFDRGTPCGTVPPWCGPSASLISPRRHFCCTLVSRISADIALFRFSRRRGLASFGRGFRKILEPALGINAE